MCILCYKSKAEGNLIIERGRWRQSREGLEKRTVMVLPQARECWQPQEAGRIKEWILPWNLQRKQSCQHLDFSPMISSYDLWPPEWWNKFLLLEIDYCSHRKAIYWERSNNWRNNAKDFSELKDVTARLKKRSNSQARWKFRSTAMYSPCRRMWQRAHVERNNRLPTKKQGLWTDDFSTETTVARQFFQRARRK